MKRIALVLLGLIVGFGLIGGALAAKKKTVTLTVEWDLQVYDDKGKPTVCKGADTTCTVRYSLILRKGAMRVGTYFSHKTEMKGHIIASWGKCSGKNKKRGLLCGLVDFDCGDSCYADVLAVNVRGGKLVIDRFAGCRGGDECTEKPKQVFSTAIGKAKVRAR